MRRMLSTYLVISLMLIFISSLFGCGSQDLGTSEDSDTDPQERTANTYTESCAICHASGKIADIEIAHQQTADAIDAAIDEVTVTDADGEIKMKVLFSLKENGIPLRDVSASSVRFTVCQLKKGSSGEPDVWQSYINQETIKESGDPGTAPDNTVAIQATAESGNASGGIFEDNGDGTYSYVFSFDFANVTEPVTVAYDENLTHRVAMQITGNIVNPVYDFRPSDGATSGIDTRNIAMTASCNTCHHRLGLHGGSRVEVKYCVTCHNPGSTDPNSGNTVNMAVMIHKIHRGENLPSVEAGGEYAIWGYRDSKHDYSDVVYPQDIRNCTKCHDSKNSATPDGDNWKNIPTIETCGSCHDNISFALPVPDGMVLHSDGPRDDNSRCAECHTAAYIANAHEIPEQAAADAFQFNIISITGTAPGEFPAVKFSVTNPLEENAAYNILTDPEFTAGGGVSRLAVIIGWNTADYHSTDSGSSLGQPISLDPLIDATSNGDGTFTVTSSVAVPADAKGSGTVAIEGHPAADPDGDSVYDVRVPVKNVVQTFTITDGTPVARRNVVDIANCNQCHGNLSLHGNNRTGEIQVCVICHNANATDVRRRPADVNTTTDKKTEETIDFKHMIHGIHGMQVREKGIVVYGYGGTEHDFSHVLYPGVLGNCGACHLSGTYEVPLSAGVLPTTVNTGNDKSGSDDDLNITRVSSVCSSCHDDSLSAVHMEQNGGMFDFSLYETTDDGGGTSTTDKKVEDQPPGHTTRTDCASCH